MSFIPIYWLGKVCLSSRFAGISARYLQIIFLLYLYLPQTNGAAHLYENYLDTAIEKLEAHFAPTPRVSIGNFNSSAATTAAHRLKYS